MCSLSCSALTSKVHCDQMAGRAAAGSQKRAYKPKAKVRRDGKILSKVGGGYIAVGHKYNKKYKIKGALEKLVLYFGEQKLSRRGDTADCR